MCLVVTMLSCVTISVHTHNPKLEGQAAKFMPPETGWLIYTPRHWVLILVALYNRKSSCGTVFIPDHHTGTATVRDAKVNSNVNKISYSLRYAKSEDIKTCSVNTAFLG